MHVGTVKQLYFPDTNVLITRFLTPEGVGEVQDFMPVAPNGSTRQRLIRRVLCVRGTMRFRVEVEPRFDYGRAPHETSVHEHGVVFHSADLTLALTSTVGLQRDRRRRHAASSRSSRTRRVTFVLETVTETYVPRRLSEDGDARGLRADRRVLAALALALALQGALARDGATARRSRSSC